MPRTGRPKAELTLTEEERNTLQEWARRRKTAQDLALRARIVLACATPKDNRSVADELKVTPQTITKWRRRFVEKRLEGLHDGERPGAPRKVTDAQVEKVVAKTLESKPKNATHWSTRRMAKELGMSQSAVSRIWRAFQLKPQQSKTFKLSTDPMFIDKVRDVVGLYMSPPDRAIVLCVDEKSQIQALDRTQPLLPIDFGCPETRTHDYVRHGTTSLFAALDVATGRVFGRCYRQHRHQEFLKFLRYIDEQVSDAEMQIHLVMDNYATHKTPAIKRWLLRHPRVHVHFTPTSASWLNQVERFFAKITEQRIRRGTFQSVAKLEKAIRDYLEEHNAEPRPFQWTATADDIFAKLTRLCERINASGH